MTRDDVPTTVVCTFNIDKVNIVCKHFHSPSLVRRGVGGSAPVDIGNSLDERATRENCTLLLELSATYQRMYITNIHITGVTDQLDYCNPLSA